MTDDDTRRGGLTRDEFRQVSWASFLDWAVRQPEFRRAFEKETGMSWDDDAEGAAYGFAVWATRTQWGWDEAPAAFRRDAEEREKRNSAGSQPPG